MREIQLSKWWRTKSAKAAFRRVEKAKRERLRLLRKKKRGRMNHQACRATLSKP